MDSMLVDNLDEAIFDEGKIVSYKWVSSLITVPFNTAKQILYQYMKNVETRKPNVQLYATYLLSAIIRDPNSSSSVHQIVVLDQQEFDTIKSNIEHLYSLHVYSLQNCILKDKNLITASHVDILKNQTEFSKVSSIQLDGLKFREVEPIAKSTDKVGPTIKEECKPPLKQGKLPAKSGISAMFANQVKKNDSSVKREVKSLPKPQKKAGLSNFVIKGMTSKVIKKPQENSFEKPIDVKPEPMDVDEDEDPLPQVTKTKNQSTKESSKPVRQYAGKRTNKPLENKAKRRRIMALEESSDSSSEEEAQPDEPLPPVTRKPCISSDDEIPATPQETRTGKRRVRKLVSKTFEDPNGYLVTKKEYEMVSEESDGENPLPPKKVTPVKAKPIQGKKQPSIMNFFKKK